MSQAEEDQKSGFYQIIRGYPCPVSKRFTAKKIEDAMDFEPEEDDLIIASYPKTGTTWMQYITLQIRSKGESFPAMNDVLAKVAPFIEMSGIAAIKAQSKPRMYKHHISYDWVQKNSKSKVIYTYRHPEDAAVSFYHFIREVEPQLQLDFNSFFDRYVSGRCAYGSYFQHVLSFYKHRDEGNLLMVSYEKLHVNRREEILKIAKFLGDEYYESLVEDNELFNRIMEHTSFDYMKKNLTLSHPDVIAGVVDKPPEGEDRKINFFRKGIVGDGKTKLTDAQLQRLKTAAEDVLKGTSILEEWYPQ